jgi:hypothetical protein
MLYLACFRERIGGRGAVLRDAISKIGEEGSRELIACVQSEDPAVEADVHAHVKVLDGVKLVIVRSRLGDTMPANERALYREYIVAR